jgi:hypothetical protein
MLHRKQLLVILMSDSAYAGKQQGIYIRTLSALMSSTRDVGGNNSFAVCAGCNGRQINQNRQNNIPVTETRLRFLCAWLRRSVITGGAKRGGCEHSALLLAIDW